MTQIKKITDKQGNNIYLRTHTKAVVDDNGYTVESRLQAMQDEINAAQLELGAVPSDIAPTEGSTNWVTSGGLYNQLNIGEANVEIDLTEYTAVRAFPNPNTWISTDDKYPYYGMFIPIEPNLKYRIKANGVGNNFYAFLTTDSHSQGASVSYATGCTRITLPADTENVDTAPSNARYLWVSTYTNSDRTPQKVEVYNKRSAVEILGNIDTTPTSNSTNLITSWGVRAALDSEGLNGRIKSALLALIDKVAFIDQNGALYRQALYDALYPENKMLYSLSAGDIIHPRGATDYYITNVRSINDYLTNKNREIFVLNYGDTKLINNNGEQLPIYPIKVPKSAKKVTSSVTPSTQYIAQSLLFKIDNYYYDVIEGMSSQIITGYTAGSTTMNIEEKGFDGRDDTYLLVWGKPANSGGTYDGNEPTEITIIFE